MTQFLGTHQNRLDAKGRVSVPAPFRAALAQWRNGIRNGNGTHLVLRPSHQHPCIEAWPMPEFHAFADPLNRLDLFSEEHDDLASALYADAFPVESDKEGRIVLPDAPDRPCRACARPWCSWASAASSRFGSRKLPNAAARKRATGPARAA